MIRPGRSQGRDLDCEKIEAQRLSCGCGQRRRLLRRGCCPLEMQHQGHPLQKRDVLYGGAAAWCVGFLRRLCEAGHVDVGQSWELESIASAKTAETWREASLFSILPPSSIAHVLLIANLTGTCLAMEKYSLPGSRLMK